MQLHGDTFANSMSTAFNQKLADLELRIHGGSHTVPICGIKSISSPDGLGVPCIDPCKLFYRAILTPLEGCAAIFE